MAVPSTRHPAPSGRRRGYKILYRVLGIGYLWLAAACAEADRSAAPAAADSAGRAVAATDDIGREVRLAGPARRVVSLLPAGTETLFALGAGGQVVGRTRYDTDSAMAHLPSVGGGLDPSLEALVALRPDLVVAWEPRGGSEIRHRLEAVGIPVFAIETRDTAAIFRNLRNLGHLTGRGTAADSILRHVRARLDSVRAAVPAGPRPRVLYVLSTDPPMVSGTDNFLAELIGVAGGEVVALVAELKGRSPQVSLEDIVRLNPDVLVVPVGEDGARAEQLRALPGWRDLRAVREGRVITVPADLAHRPGPRIAETAALLRRKLARVWDAR